MNTSGNFSGGPPAQLMSYPFPMQNHPPPLIEQPYLNPAAQQFQPYIAAPPYNPRPTVDCYDCYLFIFRILFFSLGKSLDTNAKTRKT